MMVLSRPGLILAFCLVVTPVSQASVIRPTESVAGFTQSQLADQWWQWAFSYPDGANPVQDTTGALSHLGNQGAYFFLAGAFTTDPVVRSVTVGPNQVLFFPLINVVSWAPTFGETYDEVRLDAETFLGDVSELRLALNGNPLPLPPPTTSLFDYRQTSPEFFSLVFPPDNVAGFDPGTYDAVSVGYWVALGPLAPGNYTLSFGGATELGFGEGPFSQNITYNLTVTPEPGSLIALAVVGLTGALGYGSVRRRRASTV
jgi:hypothetical protein